MKGEKILNRKLQKINILKGNLVSRDNSKSKEEVVEDITEALEDIELVLADINDEVNEEEEVNEN